MTDQVEHFRELEESLWRDAPSARDGFLAEDFTEFCRFGAVYDRNHLLVESDQEPVVEFPFENFSVDYLTDDVVLVTYENTVNDERARRSSVWVRAGAEWKLRFMQATTLEG